MRPYEFKTFKDAIDQAQLQLQFKSKLVHSARWQGSDIANRPEMATHEVAHCSFQVNFESVLAGLGPNAWLGALKTDIKPNLPWADDHFEERVCGAPINPGVQWANWPYAHSAATFLDGMGKFNHNYMERYWPKYAFGPADPATKTSEEWEALHEFRTTRHGNTGIRYDWGDLNDVVRLLAEDPYTRQAYLPVWFPEDTGGGSKRAPCTIGYHFLMRDGKCDVHYQIRSCDFVRHFRDDIYLTSRLLLWVIEEAAKIDDRWGAVTPGLFIMSIQSLHLFRNDFTMLFKGHQS